MFTELLVTARRGSTRLDFEPGLARAGHEPVDQAVRHVAQAKGIARILREGRIERYGHRERPRARRPLVAELGLAHRHHHRACEEAQLASLGEVILDPHRKRRVDPGEAVDQDPDQRPIAQPHQAARGEALEQRVASSGGRIGVRPRLTTCLGPRTTEAGLDRTTWPTTSQSNSMRTAARCCLTGRGRKLVGDLAPGLVRHRPIGLQEGLAQRASDHRGESR